jgi:hypothetical protein
VYAATAWHWLDPATKYHRAHRHLRLGGAFAFWSTTHVMRVDGDPVFVELAGRPALTSMTPATRR